jgi:RHS repeat-associated protein
MVTARMCGGQVQIADATTETTAAWASPTGTVRRDVNPAPVRVRHGGDWVPVDLTLMRAVDGSVAPTAHPDTITLSARQSESGTHELAGVGEAASRVALGWSGSLPEPELAGDTAIYRDVRPGVDLTVKATRTGVESFYVVKNRAAAMHVAELSVPITGTAVASHRRGSDGSVALLDRKGRTVAQSPAPLMWDARVNAAGEPSHVRPVGTHAAARTARKSGRTATAVDAAGVELTLTPDAAFLADEQTEYPVTIDPALTVSKASWAPVDLATATTAYWNWSGEAMVGAPDATTKRRPFFNYNLAGTAAAGKYVSAATMVLQETWAASCTARPVELYATGAATSTTTWNNQPAWGALQSSVTVAKGYSTACPDGPVNMDATAAVRAAANASPYTLTLGLRAPNETDTSYYKRFANNPTLSITYTAYPTTASLATSPSTPCVTGSSRPYLNTTTPALQASLSDPEGAAVRPQFEWYPVGGSRIGEAQPTAQASGSTFSTTVPSGALANNGAYYWRVRAYDGTTWGPWSDNCEFTVDTTAPAAAPTVSSTNYPSTGWAGSAGTPGTFTFGANGTADVAAYVYRLDSGAQSTVSPATLGASASVSVTPLTDGSHTLTVNARDRAGNLSPATTYTFTVGAGAVLSPATGDVSVGKVNVQTQGPSTATGVSLQWRRSSSDVWTAVPAADVTTTAGGTAITWPVASTGTSGAISAYPALTWNVAQTVNNAEAGASPLNGPVLLRAQFTGGTTATSPFVKFTLNLNRGTAASEDVGAGSVNLLTGNFTFTDTDVSVDSYGSDLTVSRTYNSRLFDKSDSTNMYGPGWTSSVVADDAGAPYTALNRVDSLVQIGLPDGDTIGFTARTSTTFDSEPGLENLSLTHNSASDEYRLNDTSGTETTFTRLAGAPVGTYQPTTITTPGSGQNTTITWQKATVDGVDVYRPIRILAPLPAGVASCATMVRGCRALTFAYAASTTATGTAEGTFGDYAGRVRKVSFTAWDPDLPAPAMRSVDIARYVYDTAGRLRRTWDERLDYTAGARTEHVRDAYTYDGDGVLATITPAGEESWQLNYTTVPNDASKGRLASVTRSALTAGTATTTVVYNIPVSGSGAPQDLSAAQTARWGQSQQPVDGTAVYPATQVPDGNQANGILPTSTERATVHYLDANGREANTAVPGGRIAATWYDQYGNEIRSLDAANRQRALAESATDSAIEEAALATRLSTISSYSSDGQQLLDVFGPEHDLTLADGSVVRGRTHANSAYDQGAPTGGPYNLVTTSTTTARHTVNGVDVDSDPRTTTSTYNWTLRQPSSRTVDPAGINLVTTSTYDGTTGLVTSVTNPGGAGTSNTAQTRALVYYRAGTGSGYSQCDNRPEWANLPCRLQPGGQPASGPEIPAVVTTYDLYNQRRIVTESSSNGTLRTTATTYDNAGRVYEVNTTTAGGLGTATPTIRNVYDQASGRHLRTQSVVSGTVTAQVIRAYDNLDRLTSYTDTDGVTSTTTYDLVGRTATTNDGKASRAYTYDGGTERRGLVTQVVDSQAGTFTATYDDAGNLATETWPTGVTRRMTYGEAGEATGVNYFTSSSCITLACTLYADHIGEDAHGKVRTDTSNSSTFTHAYDGAGRIAATTHTTTSGCTFREYAFSSTNRSGLNTYGPTLESCTNGSPASARTWSYDAADRHTNSGYTYDGLGRTLTMPSDDTANGAGAVTVAYHNTDFVDTITQGSRTTDYTLDVTGERVRSWTDNGTGSVATRTHHYDSDSDSPSWTEESSTAYSRNIAGVIGRSAIYTSPSGVTVWQIMNLHGDVAATLTGSDLSISSTTATDEYGKIASPSDVGTSRYGWHGASQRAADTPAGIVLMGVRLYNPTTGRFLSTDPVQGGSCNPYEYGCADPVNSADTTGKMIVNDGGGAYSGGFSSGCTGGSSCPLSSREQRLCRERPIQCGIYLSTSAWAANKANHTFPEGGHQNSFRHCIWQAMLTFLMSSAAARTWGNAHEGNARSHDSFVDRQNNVTGRAIGRAAKSVYSRAQIYWARNRICSICLNATRTGRLNNTGG